jgi:hypothetical protein
MRMRDITETQGGLKNPGSPKDLNNKGLSA